ncbi:MAG: hypothetical protein ATN34_02090 [Epulopiscium sp. Nele67-Bin002]|nr:MAG: hypothetical protein ATN34_02090 [Epulopiscium sp. Nele67-Bin002]
MEFLKERVSANDARHKVVDFCLGQKQIFVAVNSNASLPQLEAMEYIYYKGEHIIVHGRASAIKLEDKSRFTGLLQAEGKGPKFTPKISGEFELNTCAKDLVAELANENHMINKMLHHGAQFFSLSVVHAIAYFNPAEIFFIDTELNTTFADVGLNGKKRYAHSRHVLMVYNDRNVIFSVIEENGVYYTLTKADSNKVAYLKENGECHIFDGKDNHFSTTIQILDDCKVDEIAQKLELTNNTYFRDTDNLLALSFQK